MSGRLIAAVVGLLVVVAVVVGVVVAIQGDDENGVSGEGQQITVWLQVDAQNAWPEAVAAANREFEEQTGATVRVEYQTWADHLQLLSAALAAGNPPDVVELGNTETTQYMAAGSLQELDAGDFDGSGDWLEGLRDSCTFEGTLFCVPYYAGARAVIYRTDMYQEAGIEGTPDSLDAWFEAGEQLMQQFGDDQRFSAVYMPGRYWYAAMSFVYDHGGQIAEQDEDGNWRGTLDTPEAREGLQAWKRVVDDLSRAPRTTDEANPWQYQVFGQGRVASELGNGWEVGLITSESEGDPALEGRVAAYPMPSSNPGELMPTFLGGSDLAIPTGASNPELAREWIRIFTGEESMRRLAAEGGLIPNSTALSDVHADNAQLAPFAEAASSSWFVPTAVNWVQVENQNVLQDMLEAIATGRQSIDQATTQASERITEILNR